MFGLKLKLWMESHLGRARHKSSSNTSSTTAIKSKSKDSYNSGAAFSTSPFPVAYPITSDPLNSIESASNSAAFAAPVTTAAQAVPYMVEVPPEESSSSHHEVQMGPRSPNAACSSYGSSTTASILLGSFSNNLSLSSPDTGYSTDGYSPKGLFPACSFESSGKSTPKSSYTISSLVSSELLNGSISCASTKSITTGPSKNSSVSNGLELDDDSIPSSSSIISSSIQSEPSEPQAEHVTEPPRTSPACNNRANQVQIASKIHPIPARRDSNASSTNVVMSHLDDAKVQTHRRTESMDDGRGRVTCESVLRPRTASLLISSHIPDGSSPSLKNAFSICSPRRQRTKIKTNPWISFTDGRNPLPVSSGLFQKQALEPIAGSNDNCAVTMAQESNRTTSGESPEDLQLTNTEPEVLDKVLYRISTSVSVSDSGKGSLEPSTNRNSTESSCLLTESAGSSTRNSIISPEKEVQASLSLVPAPPDFLQQGQEALKNCPVAVITSKSEQVSMKETDILSDWTQTDEETGKEVVTADENEETDECITPTPSSPSGAFNVSSTTSCSSTNILPFPSWRTPLGKYPEAACSRLAPLRKSLSENSERVLPVAPNVNNKQIENSNSIIPPTQTKTTTMARGALGFFRKMFKRGSSSSSPRTGRSSRLFRPSRSNSLTDKEVETGTIIPAGLLSPQPLVVKNYPLSNTKPLSPAIANSFLTPTPNAFRRRQRDSGSECSGKNSSGKVSTTAKVKTDFIRLPVPSVSAQYGSQPQSSTAAPYYYNQTAAGQGESESKTNTMSTTSSISIMSTSSISKEERPPDPPPRTPRASVEPRRRSPPKFEVKGHLREGQNFQGALNNMKESQNNHFSEPHNFQGALNQMKESQNHFCPPQSHQRESSSHLWEPHNHQREPQSHLREGPSHLREPQNANMKAPYESPRLSRINSPSFNNYSPIHRLVVTGGNHLLGRGSPLISSNHSHPIQITHNNPQHSPHLAPHPPQPPPRTPNPINRHLATATTASPLISQRQMSAGLSANSTPVPYNHHHQQQFMASPSPILRNPRYQYIASSNQNSPLLNTPRRLQSPGPQRLNAAVANFRHPGPFFHEPPPEFCGDRRAEVNLNQNRLAECPEDFRGFQQERESYYDETPPIRMMRRELRDGHGERIYESVDDSEDEMRSDEGDGDGGDFELRVMGDYREEFSSRRPPVRIRRREEVPGPSPFPRMTLGTYLSETETRLLESDTDRKYKRLINEAESLLKEISLEKCLHEHQQHQQRVVQHERSAWLSRHAREALRQDECPQSDPLRRKAYDCWALRRLQQELAGCYASPPSLHRSRLHITSPSSSSPHQSNLSLLRHQQAMRDFPPVPSRRNSLSGNHRAC